MENVVPPVSEASFALIRAVETNNIEAMRKALTEGADVDALASYGGVGTFTPLTRAILLGWNIEVIRLLLDHGAYIEARRSYHGYTPLMQAVFSNRADIVELLLKRGADPATKDDIMRTALDLAIERSNREEIQNILRRAPRPRKRAAPPLVINENERTAISAVQTRLQSAAGKKPKVKIIGL